MMLHWYSVAATTAYPYGVYNLGLCLANEEVLGGNAMLGRRLMEFAERLDEDAVKDYVVGIASQVTKLLAEHIYNV